MNAAVCGTSASFFGRHELSETPSALRTGTAAPEVNCINHLSAPPPPLVSQRIYSPLIILISLDKSSACGRTCAAGASFANNSGNSAFSL
jgi:hypothetical protein